MVSNDEKELNKNINRPITNIQWSVSKTHALTPHDNSSVVFNR